MASTLQDIIAGAPPYVSNVETPISALKGNTDVSEIAAYPQIAAPPTAPTLQILSTAGSLTGNYLYDVAFVTGFWSIDTAGQLGTLIASGNTGGGVLSATVSPSAQQVSLSNIPIGPSGTVARVLYRTDANGSSLYYLYQIDDNATTSWTDNTPDADLGAAMPTTNTTGTVANLWKLNASGLATFNAGLTLPSGQTFTNNGTISGGVVNPASGTVAGDWTASGTVWSGDNGGIGWLGIGDVQRLIAKQFNYYSLISQAGQAWGGGSTTQQTGTTLYLDGYSSGSAPAWGGWAALKSLGVNELQLASGGSLTSQHNILDNGSGAATFAGLLTASAGITVPSGEIITNSGTYAGSPLVTSLAATDGLSVSNPTSPGAASYSLVLNGTSLSNGASGLALNLANANTWGAAQGFEKAIPLVANVATSGNFGVATVVAYAYETELTGTGTANVCVFTPTTNGLFEVRAYFRVVTGTTTVNVYAYYTDETATVQTIQLLPSTSEAVGDYSCLSVTLGATTGGPLVLVAQASVANQVFVSGTILAF